jgi:SAM-dependent MidA family methyltransferase
MILFFDYGQLIHSSHPENLSIRTFMIVHHKTHQDPLQPTLQTFVNSETS